MIRRFLSFTVCTLFFLTALVGCHFSFVIPTEEAAPEVYYTVNFCANGGSEVEDQSVRRGSKAIAPENPVKEDHQFFGWYYDSECTREFNFNTPITADIELYAKWLKDCVMTEGAAIEEPVTGSNIFVEGRNITIGSICMCDHEVTQAEWAEYMTYYGTVGGKASGRDTNLAVPRKAAGLGDNCPAYYINWYETVIYCNLRSVAEGLRPAYYMVIDGQNVYDVDAWAEVSGSNIAMNDDGKYYYNSKDNSSVLDNAETGIHYDTSANGYRLPTEAEWEYVARGGEAGLYEEQTKYSGSNDINEVAWYTGKKAHEVKQKKPNALGMYDMSGNVSEICWDWYGKINASTGALGVESGVKCVRRGGCCGNGDLSINDDCLIDNRGDPKERAYRSQYGGLRVVCSCIE